MAPTVEFEELLQSPGMESASLFLIDYEDFNKFPPERVISKEGTDLVKSYVEKWGGNVRPLVKSIALYIVDKFVAYASGIPKSAEDFMWNDELFAIGALALGSRLVNPAFKRSRFLEYEIGINTRHVAHVFEMELIILEELKQQEEASTQPMEADGPEIVQGPAKLLAAADEAKDSAGSKWALVPMIIGLFA